MVDVVHVAVAVIQLHHIVDGSHDVFQCDVLRHQFVDVFFDGSFQFFSCCVFVQQLFQHREVNSFFDVYIFCCQTEFFQICINCNCTVCQDFYFSFCYFNIQVVDTAVLDSIAQFHCQHCAFFSQNFPCHRVNHCFRQFCTADSVSQSQFLVEFVTAYFCQVITFGIEEHAAQQGFRTFHCGRFAGTQLLIDFDQTFFIRFGNVFFQSRQNLRFFTEQVNDFRVGANAQGTDQHCYGNFSGTVNSYIEYVVGVCFIFQPSATVAESSFFPTLSKSEA